MKLSSDGFKVVTEWSSTQAGFVVELAKDLKLTGLRDAPLPLDDIPVHIHACRHTYTHAARHRTRNAEWHKGRGDHKNYQHFSSCHVIVQKLLAKAGSDDCVSHGCGVPHR